jgi:uncharacterized integral membrane protein
VILLKRLLFLAVVILIGILIVQNHAYLGQSQELFFFKYRLTLFQAVWMGLAFLLGAMLFLAIDLPRNLSLKRKLRRGNGEIAKLQAEVNRLQAALAAAAPLPANPDLEKRLGL